MRSRIRASAAWTSWRVTIRSEIPPRRPRGKSARPGVAGEEPPGAGRLATCASAGDRSRLVLHEPTSQLDAVPDAELVEDRLEVALHRLGGDPQPLGHLAGAQAVRDEQGDLAFTLRESVRRGRRLHRL